MAGGGPATILASSSPRRAALVPQRILAVESSTDQCSVALWHDGAVTARRASAGSAHSERILGLVQAVLTESGLALAALDAVAFGAGPGGFTGLRVACGVAQGLAFGADLPVVPIESTAAVAAAAWVADGQGSSPVGAFLDARMQELYAAVYRLDGEPAAPAFETIAAPALVARDEAARWLRDVAGVTEPLLRAGGDGIAMLPEGLVARGFPDARPDAEWIVRLAASAVRRGAAVAPEAAGPLYVRDKVAFTTAERTARAAAGMQTGNPAAGAAA